jgi:hypothetical protein
LVFIAEKNRGAKTELLASLASSGEYWNGGRCHRSSMATTVFGGLLSSSGLAEKDEQGGKERVTAQREDKEEALGLQG